MIKFADPSFFRNAMMSATAATGDANPKESGGGGGGGGGGGRVMKPCEIPIYGFPREQKQR